ncbi:MAG TPA: response regulator [Phycisphaerales bacterium]|nr:response regulator [Phycisphaerales bacterium]
MGQGRILIIDDDPDISEAMKIVLESHGYDVDTAADGQSGMDRIRAETPDVIVLDVMMNTPQEGFTLSRELKQHPTYKKIPILMLTSVKDKTGIDFKAVAGDDTWLPVEEFLDKPVPPDILISKIESLLK